jgi:hypothetical protein
LINRDSETWRDVEALATGRIARLKDELAQELAPDVTTRNRIEIRVWKRVLRLPDFDTSTTQAETFNLDD